MLSNQRHMFINELSAVDQLSSLVSKTDSKVWSDRYEILTKLGKILKDLIAKANKIIPENEPDTKYSQKQAKISKKTIKLICKILKSFLNDSHYKVQCKSQFLTEIFFKYYSHLKLHSKSKLLKDKTFEDLLL